jgi:two-component system OmpR family sensor kinase
MIGRRLFWRIYLTLLASLALAALLIALLLHLTGDRRADSLRRMPVQLMAAAIPTMDQPPGAIQDAAERIARAVSGDITVLDRDGQIVAFSGERLKRGAAQEDDEWDAPPPRNVRVFRLHDGRTVLARFDFPLRRPPWYNALTGLLVAIGVGLAALPVVARLTHRLERLRQSVEQWGAGDLSVRVPVGGQDEIAAVSASFNRAAEHIQTLLAAHRSLLANASHELRSPLARLSLAAELWEQDPSPIRHAEIARNLAEIDQLIEEILLASRLDRPEPNGAAPVWERVDLLALAAEEAARTGANVDGSVVEIDGDRRLLRRMLRNLLENAVKHGAPPVTVHVGEPARVVVRNAGPAIPPADRERIFEPFFRPAGHAEGSGGWGLGLALVRQIAARHGGAVRCETPAEGGTQFVVEFDTGTSRAKAARQQKTGGNRDEQPRMHNSDWDDPDGKSSPSPGGRGQ